MTTPLLLDTCAIIYLFQEKPIIRTKTMKQIEQGAVILSISFAEIACKAKLEKLILADANVSNLLEKFENIEHMKIISVDATMWLDSVDLEWPENRDPVDRLIVSYAKKHNLSIVTSDQKMQKFYHPCLL